MKYFLGFLLLYSTTTFAQSNSVYVSLQQTDASYTLAQDSHFVVCNARV